MNIQEITEKIKKVMSMYQEEYPDIDMKDDFFPMKVGEEWGECLQSYLMMTGRGRKKNKSDEEIKSEFKKELSDVCGMLFLFADREGVDLEVSIQENWFNYLK